MFTEPENIYFHEQSMRKFQNTSLQLNRTHKIIHIMQAFK